MKISEFLTIIAEDMREKVPDADFSAKYILSEALGIKIPDLVARGEKNISDKNIKKVSKMCARRKKNEPLQYITQTAYFRHLELKVGTGVLIPRPETEIMIDIINERAKKNALVCDIGTGSGAIAISLAFERPDLKVYASDTSEKALCRARTNKKTYSAANLRIFKGDMFSPFKNIKFDIIASNPPYIKHSELKNLPCEIRKYEPMPALDGGKDGLDILRRFFAEAPPFANGGAFVIAEISPDQQKKIQRFIKSISLYGEISIFKDLCGRERFISAGLRVQRSKVQRSAKEKVGKFYSSKMRPAVSLPNPKFGSEKFSNF
jgi:release factor glutamine methyltransferase